MSSVGRLRGFVIAFVHPCIDCCEFDTQSQQLPLQLLERAIGHRTHPQADFYAR
jgi:hypothetical protein